MIGNLCNYGCGQEAKHQLKNKKYCCSKFFMSCPEMKKRLFGENNISKRVDVREKKSKKLKNHFISEETKKKISFSNKGKKHSEESKRKISEANKKIQKNAEWNRKNSDALKGRKLSKEIKTKISKAHKIFNQKNPWRGQKQREYMLNGGAAHCNQFLKNPSKPQIELFHLCQQLVPYPILNYPVFNINKCIDIAIPSLNIAIEYDQSWWHKDKEADRKRQNLLEEEGWTFIRYIDYIPTKQELFNDIKDLIE